MAARRSSKSIAVSVSKPTGELPAGTPAWITPEIVEQTLRVWQPRYQTPLTTEDAIGILVSASRLMRALSAEPGA